jgi:hypothetical protein
MPSGDDPDEGPNSESIQPSMTIHPVHYPAVPTHMFPISDDLSSSSPRSKRRQVKKACSNCQKACKKCDDGRPCKRCITYGTADECIDTQRKERKKGIKRGPYKKREGRCTYKPRPIILRPFHLKRCVFVSNATARAAATSEELPDASTQPGSPDPNNAAASVTPPAGAFMPSVGYPAGLPFIPPHAPRPGDGHTYYYIPVPVMAPPPQAGSGNDGDHSPIFAQPQFYPGPYFNPYAQPHAYLMPPQRGPDGQLAAPPHFSYGPFYSAPPQGGETGGADSDSGNGEPREH